MKKVVMDSTVAKFSGALSIFIHFIESVHILNRIPSFISVDSFNRISNFIVFKKFNNNWIERILLDYNGLNDWCSDNKIVPDLLISFQYTCTICDKISIPE